MGKAIGCLVLIVSFLSFGRIFAQNISGRVTDKSGAPLPHATIYVEGTTSGAIAGFDGRFTLNLPVGNYRLQAKYVGYQTQSIPLLVTDASQTKTLNFKLNEEELTLPDVIITPDGRDPAYAIIARAVERKTYFKKLLKQYTYRAYTKTKIQLLKRPGKFFGISSDDKDTGVKILYFSENLSEVAVEEPDKIKERVTASRVNGDSKSYSLFANLFLRFSLYENLIKMEGLTDRGFISPLSDNTFFSYDFKLLGTTRDRDKTIYKIKIIPKRKNDPVFAGNIWIVDSSFAVQGFDINITRERQLEVIDSINITQNYIPAGKEAWTPAGVRFDFLGGVLGAKFGGYSASALSDYNLEPELEKKYFNNELLSVSQEAVEKDSSFWQTQRPIPLETDEKRDIIKKDSIEKRENSPEYQDSLTKARAKFKFGVLLRGYRRYDYRRKNEWNVSAPLSWVNFNTMEGWNLAPTVTYRQIFDDEKKRLSFTFRPRYGFSNEKFSYMAEISYNFQGARGRFSSIRNFITVSGGDYPQYFGVRVQIPPTINTIYTLFSELNYLKMYQNRFASIAAGKELFNGLTLRGSLTYENRIALTNSTEQTWFPTNRYYSPNILIPSHQALIAEARFTITFDNKYVTTPDGKFNFGSNYPVLNLYYKRGLPVVSGADFDFVRLTLEDDFKLGLVGTLDWQIGAGKFFTHKRVEFPDLYQPLGNQTILRGGESLTRFGLQNYYSYGTNDAYLEGYAEHHFDGFILNKIPLIKKLGLQEIAGARYFYTQAAGNYLELDMGLENIGKKWLKLTGLRFDIYYRLLGKSYTNIGFTLSLRN